MQLHASLLVAVCCALSFPFMPAEQQFDWNERIIDRFTVMNEAVTWNSDTIPAHIASQSATLDPGAVTTLNVPGAHPIRTTARLTIPDGAHWQTVMVNESLILTLESGELRVRMVDGQARIARAAETNLGGSTLNEITPGQEAIMRAGDRLVAHGDGALSMQSDDTPSTASIIRVGLPAMP